MFSYGMYFDIFPVYKVFNIFKNVDCIFTLVAVVEYVIVPRVHKPFEDLDAVDQIGN